MYLSEQHSLVFVTTERSNMTKSNIKLDIKNSATADALSDLGSAIDVFQKHLMSLEEKLFKVLGNEVKEENMKSLPEAPPIKLPDYIKFERNRIEKLTVKLEELQANLLV